MFLDPRPPPITPEAILEALENAYDRRILAMAQDHTVDAQEIIETTGMPKSTAYRRINRLRDNGLLKVEGGGIRHGHTVERYRATVETLTVRIEDGELWVDWERWKGEEAGAPPPPQISPDAPEAEEEEAEA